MNRPLSFILVLTSLIYVEPCWGQVGQKGAGGDSKAPKQDEELQVLRLKLKALEEDISLMMKEADRLRKQNQSLLKDTDALQLKYKEAVQQLKANELKANLAELAAKLREERARAEVERLKLENAAISKSLQRSKQDKLTLQEFANRYRTEAATYKNERDIVQNRYQNLVDLLRHKDDVIKALAGKKPSAVNVGGKITEVSKDKNDGGGVLVKLSVGLDQGVNKGQTLDVFRIAPKPQYLGRLQIVESKKTDSIGRIVGKGPMDGTLQVGDLVVVNSISGLAEPKK